MGSTPFTAEQFLRLFETYNVAIWPMQVVVYVLAGLAVVLAVKRTAISGRLIGAVLAFLWLWIGVVYNLFFFAPINPAAFAFGAIFIIEGVLFLAICVWGDRITYGVRADTYSFVGAVFIGYAMVLYPLLGALTGDLYPQCPVFGVTPCPTIMYTFGILLFALRRVPWALIIIPLVWSFIGLQAAILFGMQPDFALPAVGVLGTVLIILKNRMLARSLLP
jgi:hypothetical protein